MKNDMRPRISKSIFLKKNEITTKYPSHKLMQTYKQMQTRTYDRTWNFTSRSRKAFKIKPSILASDSSLTLQHDMLWARRQSSAEAHSEGTGEVGLGELWNHFRDQYIDREGKNTKIMKQPPWLKAGRFPIWLREFSFIAWTSHITSHQILPLLFYSPL